MERKSKTPKISEEVADRYLHIRQFLRNTTDEMAKQAGVSVTVISGIENAKVSKINTYYTAYLVEKKGINPNYLTGKSSEMFANVVENTSSMEDLRKKNEILENKIHDLEQTVSILLGELERLKKIQTQTWANNEQGSPAPMGKFKTVGISGNGRRFSVQSPF